MMLSIKIYKLQSASIRLKLSQLCIDCSHGYRAHPHDQASCLENIAAKAHFFFQCYKRLYNRLAN